MRVPPGGTVYSKGRPGLWISGICVFAAFYVSTAITASVLDDFDPGDDTPRQLYAPVIGPFLYARHATDLGRPFVLFDGIAQTAGATLIVLGATLRRKILEYQVSRGGFRRRVAIAPMLAPRTAGVSVAIF